MRLILHLYENKNNKELKSISSLMRKSTIFALISIILFSIFIRTYPLFQYSLWAVDCGEYVYYTEQWISNGSIYLNIDGWGQAYPYFPGLFILTGTFKMLSGQSVLSSTVFYPIILSSFVPLLVFVLVHRITKNWKPALLSGLFLTTIAPFVYNYSQPKPETIGFFLMVLILSFTLFISEDRKKIFILIIPASLALLVTHHLSSFFLLLFLIGGIFFSKVIRKKAFRRDNYRLYLFLYFVSIIIIYWVLFATPFRKNRIYNALGLPSYSILFAPYLLVLFILLLRIFREKIDFKLSVNLHLQSLKSFLILSLPVVLISLIALLYSGFVNIPGRDMRLGSIVLIYIPLIPLASFCVGARKIIRAFKEGLLVIGWVAFVSLSMLLGVVTSSSSLLPMRQLAFLLFSISILFGLGVMKVHDMINPSIDKNKAIAFFIIIFVLLTWTIPFTYPTQDMLNGYQEGTDWNDLESAYWSESLSGKIATDHRMSAALFSLGIKNVTWEKGRDIYLAEDHQNAIDEIDNLSVKYLLLEEDMRRGVIISSDDQPKPISQNLINYYKEKAYCVYSNEDCEIYILS